jgi:hypothetical protein
MDSPVSAKDEIWFLRVCRHVSNAVYYCLLNQTLQWRWQFLRNNAILSVQVLVKALGVKLLKVISSEITVC